MFKCHNIKYYHEIILFCRSSWCDIAQEFNRFQVAQLVKNFGLTHAHTNEFWRRGGCLRNASTLQTRPNYDGRRNGTECRTARGLTENLLLRVVGYWAPWATSHSIYANWVEQKDYGSTADFVFVYYRRYFWFVRFHRPGHPLRLQSICLPGQEERHATGLPNGPSTWQSWVPVSESKYTQIALFLSKKCLCIFIFDYAFDLATHFGNFCLLQVS